MGYKPLPGKHFDHQEVSGFPRFAGAPLRFGGSGVHRVHPVVHGALHLTENEMGYFTLCAGRQPTDYMLPPRKVPFGQHLGNIVLKWKGPIKRQHGDVQ